MRPRTQTALSELAEAARAELRRRAPACDLSLLAFLLHGRRFLDAPADRRFVDRMVEKPGAAYSRREPRRLIGIAREHRHEVSVVEWRTVRDIVAARFRLQ